ncbi:unnamed protein product [Rhodiola kirilowii]
MKCVSWNCRGVGGPRAVRAISDVVNTHRPSILGLIETKKSNGDWESLRYKLGFKGCFAVRSSGKAGGLAVLWSDDVEVELQSYSNQHIDIWIKGDNEFFLTLLYGNPRSQDRHQGWELLRTLRREGEVAWVVVGDFNEVAFTWEAESRRERQAWQMNNFKRCLDDCGLTDLGYEGEMYTYSNRRTGELEVRARLDRVVANQAWRSLFPQASVKHILANSSDHLPILLSTVRKKERRRACREKILRFEPMWLRHKDFKEVIRNQWINQSREGALAEKLSSCMQQLKQWNNETFGNVKKKVEKLNERIQEIRALPRTQEIILEEAQLSDELDEWLEREEIW